MEEVISKFLATNDAGERLECERKLKEAETTDIHFGSKLLAVISEPRLPVPVRQFASILLRQFIQQRWKDLPTLTQDSLRKALAVQLNEEVGQIRIGVASACARVAFWEFSTLDTQHSVMLEFLMDSAFKHNTNLSCGALHAIKELFDMENLTVEPAAKAILPMLILLIRKDESIPIKSRCIAVEIFKKLVEAIRHIQEATDSTQQQSVSKRVLFPWLQEYSNALLAELEQPMGSDNNLPLKINCITTLTCLVESFGKAMGRWYSGRLVSIVASLSAWTAKSHVENKDKDSDGDAADMEDLSTVDSESLDESTQLRLLYFGLSDMIQTMCLADQFTELMVSFYDVITGSSLYLLQISDSKAEAWKEVDLFLEEEDEENALTSSFRASAKDNLLSLLESNPEPVIKALCGSVKEHSAAALVKRTSGDTKWWKQLEACVTALGLSADFIWDNQNALSMDFSSFISDFVLPSLESSNFPLLRGQSLWFLARIVGLLPAAWKNNVIQACLLFLQREQPSLIRVCALRAIYNVCGALSTSGEQNLLAPYVGQIVSESVSLALNASESVIACLLGALQSTVRACPEEAAKHEAKLGPLLMAATIKYSGDPIIPSLTSETLGILMSVESARDEVIRRVVPTALSVIRNPQPNTLPVHLPSVCMELLTGVVEGSGVPLARDLVEGVFPEVATAVLASGDVDILASGRECLRALLYKSPQQLMAFRDAEGRTGPAILIQVVCHLLGPEAPALSSSMVNRLMYALMRFAADAVRPDLPRVLQRVLAKMAQEEAPSVRIALLTVIGYLLNYDPETTVGVLLSSPFVSHPSALHFVVADWEEKYSSIYGSHDKKITVLALSKLVEYGVSDGGEALRSAVSSDGLLLLCQVTRLLVREWRHLRRQKDNSEDQEEGLLGKDYGELIATFANEDREWDSESESECEEDPVKAVDVCAHLEALVQRLPLVPGLWFPLLHSLSQPDLEELRRVHLLQ